MKIMEMSKADFAVIPYLKLYTDWEKLAPNGRLEFKSFVIIPVERDGKIVLHDSEWACMDLVLINSDNEPIGKVGGGTDIVDLDGIGGYGSRKNRRYWDTIGNFGLSPKGWRIDCLPCGYLRVLARQSMFLEDPFVGSDFEVYSEDNATKKNYCNEEE